MKWTFESVVPTLKMCLGFSHANNSPLEFSVVPVKVFTLALCVRVCVCACVCVCCWCVCMMVSGIKSYENKEKQTKKQKL